MHVARSADELDVTGPCLVDRYLSGALELDVEVLSDGEEAWTAAILEHVEPAGVHSGDSACLLPGPSVTPALDERIRATAAAVARAVGGRGLLNLQLAVSDDRLYVLEANPRASRTAAFVAKATGVPLVEHAVRLLLGERISDLELPERVDPSRAWRRRWSSRPSGSPGADARGPEMRSTGEVMASAACRSVRIGACCAQRARRGVAAR